MTRGVLSLVEGGGWFVLPSCTPESAPFTPESAPFTPKSAPFTPPPAPRRSTDAEFRNLSETVKMLTGNPAALLALSEAERKQEELSGIVHSVEDAAGQTFATSRAQGVRACQSQ